MYGNNKKTFFIKILVVACCVYFGVVVYVGNGSNSSGENHQNQPNQPQKQQQIQELQQPSMLVASNPNRNLEAIVENRVHVEEQQQQQQQTESKVEQNKPQQQQILLEAEPPVVQPKEETTVFDQVKTITNCLDKPQTARTQQRGDYWVLYNYIRAEKTFECHETITYTTHADYSFLDNLVPLLEHWNGPISVALHAPGNDFKNTLDSIGYLRDCTDSLVRELVTFHVYFSTKHVPKEVPKHGSHVLNGFYNCSLQPPYLNVSSDQMYKTQKNLLYPVNVGRNIARETAQTHFILPSDIELYPSAGVIPKFLTMIAENKGALLSRNPKVFPLHIFEVSASAQVPENKTKLIEMLKNGTAIPFHKKVCPECHAVPKSKEWQQKKESTDGKFHVFHVGKRNGRFVHWEPIFIGTHSDPLYDERLSWEGKSDKMTQGYALCVMDYNFLILDDAFLVHKPGIKIYKKDAKRDSLAGKTRRLIKKIIFPELKILYGVRKGCAV